MDWPLFLIFLAACAAAGSTGQMFPPGSWYEALRKPLWTPPNRLFPLAWTLLYIAIAVAATRVALREGNDAALSLWALQIALNTHGRILSTGSGRRWSSSRRSGSPSRRRR